MSSILDDLLSCCSSLRRSHPRSRRRTTIHKEGSVASTGTSSSNNTRDLASSTTTARGGTTSNDQQSLTSSLYKPSDDTTSSSAMHGNIAGIVRPLSMSLRLGSGDAAKFSSNKNGSYGLLLLSLNMQPPAHISSTAVVSGGNLFTMLEFYKQVYHESDFKHISTFFMTKRDGSMHHLQALQHFATTTHALLIAWNMDNGLSGAHKTVNAFIRQFYTKPVPIILYAETKQPPPPTPQISTIDPNVDPPHLHHHHHHEMLQSPHAHDNCETVQHPSALQFPGDTRQSTESSAGPPPQFYPATTSTASLEDRVHALIDSFVVGTCLQAHKHVTTVVVFDVDMLNEKRLRKCIQWASKQARKSFGFVDVMTELAAASNNASVYFHNNDQRDSIVAQQRAASLAANTADGLAVEQQSLSISNVKQYPPQQESAMLNRQSDQQHTEEQPRQSQQVGEGSMFRSPTPSTMAVSQNNSAQSQNQQPTRRSSSTQTTTEVQPSQQQFRSPSQRPSSTPEQQQLMSTNQLQPQVLRPPRALQNANTTPSAINAFNASRMRNGSVSNASVVLALAVPKQQTQQRESSPKVVSAAEARRQLIQNINTIQRNFKTVLEWAVSEESLSSGVVQELVAIVRGDETNGYGEAEEFPVTLKLEQPAVLELVISVLNGLYTANR